MEEMTEKEAIKYIECRMRSGKTKDEVWQAGDMAIKAIEKQIPKKPIIKAEKEVPTTHNLGRLLEICCPVCGKRIFAIYETDLKRGGGVTRDAKGCSRCLQAIDFTGYYYTPKLDKSDEDIDWSEEDE